MPLPSIPPVLLSLSLAVTLVACGSDRYAGWTDEEVDECRTLDDPPAPRVPDADGDKVEARLRSLDSCDGMADRIRDQALVEMESWLDASERAYLASACQPDDDGGGDDEAGASGDGSEAPEGDTGSGAGDYSQTNNQVEGVDEPDFVKNDADYVYVAANGALRIIDAWPAPEAHVAAVAEIEGTPVKMFVAEDRAVVYSSLPLEQGEGGEEWGDGSWGTPGECTYGYDCEFTGDGHPTKVTILDISDRAQPAVEREIWLSGSLVSARRIGTSVHTVVSDAPPEFPGLRYGPDSGEYGELDRPRQIHRAFDRLREENRRMIRESALGDIVPYVRDVVGGEARARADGPLGDCSSTYATAMTDGASVTSVLSMDITSAAELAVTSVVSRPGAVYASPESLYMAVPHTSLWQGWFEELPDEKEASSVHKFALGADPVRAEYRGSGVVKGRVLNQFAMDEREGDLRIATTSGRVPDPDVYSTLTVMRESEGGLAAIGKVDRLAPDEDIRSVRFDGDRGFIVTFKKTDPLFVIDLATPEEPRVAGELKIPGFSTYMHMMGPEHLLTIGYDASDQGDFAWFTGVLLQIFDVSDLSKPTLAHREVIGTRGSTSEALTNHLAFNYYPTRDALALPMTICEGGDDDGGYGSTMTFSGLMLYQVTAADGFALTGQVDHPAGEEVGCWNWWTAATTQVERSVFMENYVFSISHSRIKVNAMEELSTDLAEISLDESAPDEPEPE